jgi:hypothetical protein
MILKNISDSIFWETYKIYTLWNFRFSLWQKLQNFLNCDKK